MTDSFGARIATKRAELGLTQRELAAKAGVSWSQISRYESDQAIPRLRVLMSLAAALDLNIEDLRATSPPKSSKLKIYEGFSSRLIRVRSNTGISRGQLAKQTGIDPDDIADFELGVLFPTPDEVVAIAKVLRVEPAHLAGARDEPEAIVIRLKESDDESPDKRSNLVAIYPEAYDTFVATADRLNATPGELMSAIVFREAFLLDHDSKETPSIAEYLDKLKKDDATTSEMPVEIEESSIKHTAKAEPARRIRLRRSEQKK